MFNMLNTCPSMLNTCPNSQWLELWVLNVESTALTKIDAHNLPHCPNISCVSCEALKKPPPATQSTQHSLPLSSPHTAHASVRGGMGGGSHSTPSCEPEHAHVLGLDGL